MTQTLIGNHLAARNWLYSSQFLPCGKKPQRHQGSLLQKRGRKGLVAILGGWLTTGREPYTMLGLRVARYVTAWLIHGGTGGHPLWVLAYQGVILAAYQAYAAFGPSPARNVWVWGEVRPLNLAMACVAAAAFAVGSWPFLSVSANLAQALKPLTYPHALAAYTLGPVKEELLYRGILLRRLSEGLGFWPGLILSAIVFAIQHGNPLGAFLFGVWFGLLYSPLLAGNLIVPAVLHIFANITGAQVPAQSDGF